MINKEYLNQMPNWWNERKYYDLVLSDDIDSFMACEVLKQVKGWEINYFYNFDLMGLTENANKEEYIGVDIAFNNNQKCFDNHVVMLSKFDYCNLQSINFNVVDRINRSNYFNKYCGSTLLLIWSLYDLPLPKPEEGKLILLAIDSTFKSFYSPYANDKKSNKHFLVDVMGFQELYEVLKRHEQVDFIKIIKKYRLNEKIEIKNGYLQTNIDLERLRKVFDLPFLLPKNKFHLKNRYKKKVATLPSNDLNICKNDICQNMFSLALTKKNFLNYSVAY